MEKNEFLDGNVDESILKLERFEFLISILKTLIICGEDTEPDILSKECYNAFYEFVDFNLTTRQRFLDHLAWHLNGKKGSYLLSCKIRGFLDS